MGIEYHEAIIISCYTRKTAMKYYKVAKECFSICPISCPTKEATNSISSFMISPDGSKEGWDTSTTADKERLRFIDCIIKQSRKLGGCEWVWVKFGYDVDNPYVVKGTNHNPMGNNYYDGEMQINKIRHILKPR